MKANPSDPRTHHREHPDRQEIADALAKRGRLHGTIQVLGSIASFVAVAGSLGVAITIGLV